VRPKSGGKEKKKIVPYAETDRRISLWGPVRIAGIEGEQRRFGPQRRGQEKVPNVARTRERGSVPRQSETKSIRKSVAGRIPRINRFRSAQGHAADCGMGEDRLRCGYPKHRENQEKVEGPKKNS